MWAHQNGMRKMQSLSGSIKVERNGTTAEYDANSLDESGLQLSPTMGLVFSAIVSAVLWWLAILLFVG